MQYRGSGPNCCWTRISYVQSGRGQQLLLRTFAWNHNTICRFWDVWGPMLIYKGCKPLGLLHDSPCFPFAGGRRLRQHLPRWEACVVFAQHWLSGRQFESDKGVTLRSRLEEVRVLSGFVSIQVLPFSTAGEGKWFAGSGGHLRAKRNTLTYNAHFVLVVQNQFSIISWFSLVMASHHGFRKTDFGKSDTVPPHVEQRRLFLVRTFEVFHGWLCSLCGCKNRIEYVSK